jgi:regulator of protease activity HflC (stomatin/prohibitin superfamily)
MFQQILDLIVACWDHIIPVVIIDAWERAIILRCGKFHREVGAGIHWKIPLFERVLAENIATTTHNSEFQSITTKDGLNIVIACVAKYHVSDVKTFLILHKIAEVEKIEAEKNENLSAKVMEFLLKEAKWEEAK